MNIGKVIKELRSKQEMTQQELADLIGITQTSLSQIESGITRPSAKTLASLSMQLNVPEVFIYLLSVEEEDVPIENRSSYNILFPSIQKLFTSAETQTLSKQKK